MSIIDMLEKLAEMFPTGVNGVFRLTTISSKRPKNTADVEHLQRQFETHQARGLIL